MVEQLSELLDANAVEYKEVEAYGVTLRLGSLSSFDLLEWIEANDDPNKRKVAGFRILAKSLVDSTGKRLVTPETLDSTIASLRLKDATHNAKAIRAALALNGLSADEKPKNDSGGTASGASPSASPSPTAA